MATDQIIALGDLGEYEYATISTAQYNSLYAELEQWGEELSPKLIVLDLLVMELAKEYPNGLPDDPTQLTPKCFECVAIVRELKNYLNHWAAIRDLYTGNRRQFVT